MGAATVDICDELNGAGTPTTAGSSRWWPSHVSRLLRTRAAKDLLRRENPVAECAAVRTVDRTVSS